MKNKKRDGTVHVSQEDIEKLDFLCEMQGQRITKKSKISYLINKEYKEMTENADKN